MAQYPNFLLHRYSDCLRTHYKLTPADIARETGLNQTLVTSEQLFYYPNDEHALRLIRFLGDTGYLRDYEIPDLQLTEGMFSGTGALGDSALSVLRNAPTLKAWLDNFMKISHIMPAHRHWMEKHKGCIRIYHDFVNRQEAFVAPQALFTMMLNELVPLFGLTKKDVQISFMQRGISNEMQFYNATHHEFCYQGNTSYLQFNLDTERVVNRYYNPLINANLTAHLDRKLTEILAQHGLDKKVRTLLQDYLVSANSMLSIDEVARVMNLSKSTLYRRLESEGTSFSDIAQETRTELAKMLLRDKKYSISMISDRLGFAAANVFTRAFKQATGMSPTDYRNRRV